MGLNLDKKITITKEEFMRAGAKACAEIFGDELKLAALTSIVIAKLATNLFDKEETPEAEPKPEPKKITLKEFWDSKDGLCIHCDTEEKAHKLLEAFHKLGKTWSSGDSYLSITNWNRCAAETCYSNENMFCSKQWYSEYNYTIYEFEDVILDD